MVIYKHGVVVKILQLGWIGGIAAYLAYGYSI